MPLLNTAQGRLVDEAALYEALTSGRPAAAGLDVFEQQPPSVDNPLLRLDNFLAGIHVAGSTHEAWSAPERPLQTMFLQPWALTGENDVKNIDLRGIFRSIMI